MQGGQIRGFLDMLWLSAFRHQRLRRKFTKLTPRPRPNIGPFREFLEVSAQCNGELINYAKIARDVGVEDTTIKTYFDILEDTYIGVRLPAYGRSVRKQQTQAPKFYLFDVGVAGALVKRRIPEERGEQFGRAFEHFIFTEIAAHASYRELDYDINYWRTNRV